MCNDCRGTHKHYHWLTFTSVSALEEHLRFLTHRDDQIQSIVTWWQDTRSLYKDTVSAITGAPIPVSEAWRDAQLAPVTEPVVSDRVAAAEARVQQAVDDPSLNDKAVMRAAVRQIDGLLSHMPDWPEPPPKHTPEEIAAYLREERGE